MLNPTERFSTRVENYIKYRPDYPADVLDLLRADCGLTESAVVADVGSGTGILTRRLLPAAHHVYGVEPNREMRVAGEQLLKGYVNFTSVAATAEATKLPDQSVDLITAGQAFHWFDRLRARSEFKRILKPDGRVALIWNSRRTAATPFLRGYEQLLQDYATDYAQVDHTNIGAEEIAAFFAPNRPQLAVFENLQVFDFDGLRGRLLSSSYAPEPGHPNHEPMLEALRRLFDTHQTGGRVQFEYDTEISYGSLS